MSSRYRAVAPKRVVVAEPTVEAVDFAALKKDELVAVATKRGVDASGTKAEIVARLNG